VLIAHGLASHLFFSATERCFDRLDNYSWRKKMTDKENETAAAGDLDPSFNGSGVLWFRFYKNEPNLASDVVVGKDERIYIGGTVIGRFAIAVLNKDGSFSNDFNGNGMLIDSFHKTERSRGWRIALEEEKVLMLGTTEVPMAGGIRICPAIARYHPDGVLDTTFGNTGYKVVNPEFEDGDVKFLMPNWQVNWSIHNKKIYVAAFRVRPGVESSMVVTCLDSEGHIDTEFGNAGTIVVKHSRVPQLEHIRATEEGIYLGGHMAYGAVGGRAFCRISLTGKLDTTYGTEGFIIDDTPFSGVNALPQQESPKLLGIGRNTRQEEGDQFIRYQGALVSLEPGGSPDKEFNNGEPVFTEIDYATSWLFGAVQEDGRIVTLGETGDPSSLSPRNGSEKPALWDDPDRRNESALSNYRMAVGRYLKNGDLDTSFGKDERGWITFNINDKAQSYGIAVQPDNGILIVGNTGDYSVFVVRFKG
jgi:uncharacterized delta-60 repeat protein